MPLYADKFSRVEKRTQNPQKRGRLRKRTTKHANGWRVRLNPKKLRRKRQTRQETALI